MASERNSPLPAANFRAIELAWLQDHAAELTKQHPGEWLAVDGPQLVAHASHLTALLHQATEAGHPNPFITAAPAADAPHSFASPARGTLTVVAER